MRGRERGGEERRGEREGGGEEGRAGGEQGAGGEGAGEGSGGGRGPREEGRRARFPEDAECASGDVARWTPARISAENGTGAERAIVSTWPGTPRRTTVMRSLGSQARARKQSAISSPSRCGCSQERSASSRQCSVRPPTHSAKWIRSTNASWGWRCAWTHSRSRRLVAEKAHARRVQQKRGRRQPGRRPNLNAVGPRSPAPGSDTAAGGCEARRECPKPRAKRPPFLEVALGSAYCLRGCDRAPGAGVEPSSVAGDPRLGRGDRRRAGARRHAAAREPDDGGTRHREPGVDAGGAACSSRGSRRTRTPLTSWLSCARRR